MQKFVFYVRHLQMSEVEPEKISELFKGKKSFLRTLFAPSEIRQDFNKMPHVSLRALHWHTHYGILKAVNAKHLRYLDLSTCSPDDGLLDSICLLYNLQTLRLNDCYRLRQLPENLVINLRKLVHLYLFGCSGLDRMPRNIGKLKNFLTLTTFIVDTREGCGIDELKDLQHLSNRLELYNLRKIQSVNHAKEAHLKQKQNLSELLFCWGLTRYDKPESEACNEKEVFQCLQPHDNIEIMELYGYGGLEMPQWMGYPQMFKCLRKLKIFKCTRCKNIPLVWLSSSLVYLSLEDMGELKSICDNLDIEGGGDGLSLHIFPNLKKMNLKHLPSLERWAENSAGESVDSLVVFPVLEEATIEDCPMLASFPSSPILRELRISLFAIRQRMESSPEEVPPLYNSMLPASLEVCWIQGYECWVALPPNLGELAKLQELLVNNCYGLTSLPDGMHGLTSLRELTISGSPEIEEFPHGLLERLPTLECLSIDGCPELERRCREGGEYFDLVSSIPRKYIQQASPESVQVEESGIEALEPESEIEATETETGIEAPEPESEIEAREAESRTEAQSGTEAPEAESRVNKFLRRLIPCCARSNSDSN
uniref:Uncharacterized protein n=1 Tax=Avena sativa TaxID=4498 RepID=A0ACD6APV1_AVESA